MVPRKVGEGLRRRRLVLDLKQSDIATACGTTRAYISAVERGVDWEPDAAKLIRWSTALGWPEDHILSRLGRSGPIDAEAQLSPMLLAAIKDVVTAGIRDGLTDVLREMNDERTLAVTAIERDAAPKH